MTMTLNPPDPTAEPRYRPLPYSQKGTGGAPRKPFDFTAHSLPRTRRDDTVVIARCWMCGRPLTHSQIAARFEFQGHWRHTCADCEPAFNREVVIPATDGRPVCYRRNRLDRVRMRVTDRDVAALADRWATDNTHVTNWN